MSVVLVCAALTRGLSAIAFAVPFVTFVATLARPRPARAEGCVVRGAAVSLESVVVRPAGAPKIQVDVSGLPATARIPTTPGAPAPLTFAGTLAFHGTAKNIWYELAKPAAAHHGIVHLSPGARLVRAHAEGADVVGRLVWAAEDILEGEDKDPDAWIANVRVPCASLRLANDRDAQAEAEEAEAAERAGGDGEAGGDAEGGDADGADDDPDPAPGDGTWWQTRRGSDRLLLHASPRAASPTATLRRHVDPSSYHWTLARLAEQGSWMKVTAAGDAARVTGWIRREEVEQLDGPVGVGGGCYGQHGGWLGGHGWGGKPPKIAYQGPAEIAVGTTLYTGRGDGAWAKVAKRDATFEVVVYEGREWGEWAEVTGVPGVGGAGVMTGVYVRAGAVRSDAR